MNLIYESLSCVNTNATLKLDILLTHDSQNFERRVPAKYTERKRCIARGLLWCNIDAESGGRILDPIDSKYDVRIDPRRSRER